MSKIALPIAELKRALTGLGKVLNRKSTLPALEHVKIERTQDGWIGLSVNNLEQYATVRLEQPNEGKPTQFLVPFHDLQKIMKSCAREDTIYLQPVGPAKEPSVILQYPIGKELASSTVATVPVEEFPEIPRIEGKTIPLRDNLRTSIQEAMECSSDDETRYILQAAFIDVSEKNCHHVVGTNGRILYSSNSFALPLEKSLIIPKHPFLGWKEFNSDGEWQLQIGKEGANHPPHFQISTRRWSYISKQIEGNYPNWRQVMVDSKDANSRFEFDPESLPHVIQTIQRMPCHDEKDFALGLELTGKTLRLLGKPTGPDRWTKVEVPTIKARGKDVVAFFNRHFLTTALKFGLNTIEIVDEMSPMRLSNGGRQVILMTLRGQSDPSPAAKIETSPPDESVAEETAEAAAEAAISGPVEEEDAITGAASSSDDAAGVGDGTQQPQPPANEVDQILEAVDDIRESLQTNLVDLKSITGKLKQIKREKRTTERDIQTLRRSVEVLQSVRS